jgi:hypothetical protein
MKKILSLLGVFALAIVPVVSSAQIVDGDAGDLGVTVAGLVDIINVYLIPFVLALAFLVFVWGMFKFFILGGANDEAKESGKSLIIYALAGFVLILIFWGLVNFLVDLIGVDVADVPTFNTGPTIN